MFVANENAPEMPDPEDVIDAQHTASELLDEVEKYRSEAQWHDDRFTDANEHRTLHLDDLPYGEELIRTRPLPGNLTNAIGLIEKISEGKLPPKDAETAFKEAMNLIEGARSELDDCKDLPPENDPEEDSN